jgi:hypothetical protein
MSEYWTTARFVDQRNRVIGDKRLVQRMFGVSLRRFRVGEVDHRDVVPVVVEEPEVKPSAHRAHLRYVGE